MRVLTLYNRYRTRVHGEETVVNQSVRLLRTCGVDVDLVTRDSGEIGDSLYVRGRVAVRAIYNPQAASFVRRRIATTRPDVVHAHNLYPLFSPSVLLAAARAEIPVVLSLHHFFLTCPTLMHYRQGAPCMKCLNGGYHHAVLGNCRGGRAESIAYALRSAIARQLGWFHDSVSAYVALTEFARSMLIEAGYPSQRIHVISNTVEIPKLAGRPTTGDYIAFVGRLTAEKGIDDLLQAARITGLPVKIAGEVEANSHWVAGAPSNVEFVGLLRGDALAEFYQEARIVVVPSRWFEMCPMVVLEAMSYGRTVVASRIGGMNELVIDGETGRLVAPGDAVALADALVTLWHRPLECERMGAAGRVRAERQFNESGYAEKLLALYQSLREKKCFDVNNLRAEAVC